MSKLDSNTSGDSHSEDTWDSATTDRGIVEKMRKVSFSAVDAALGGKYSVSGILGKGASAVVYKATQVSVGRPVAVKILRPEAADSKERARYMREANVIGSMRHPNIVMVFDIDVTTADSPYISMEYIEGGSLAQRLDGGARLAPATTVSVLEQLAAALSHAHEKGVVHRDIKLGNVLIAERDGQLLAKLSDFGVSRVHGSNLTEVGIMMGTPSYMAPETLKGGPCTAQSDVYALGILAYRMLVGRTPFVGDDVLALAVQHVNEPVPPMREFAPELDIPRGLERFVMRCLEKDPSARYSSMNDALVALVKVRLDSYPTTPSSTSEGSRMSTTISQDRLSVSLKSGGSAGTPLQWMSLLALGSAVGLVVLLVAGMMFWSSSDDSSSPDDSAEQPTVPEPKAAVAKTGAGDGEAVQVAPIEGQGPELNEGEQQRPSSAHDEAVSELPTEEVDVRTGVSSPAAKRPSAPSMRKPAVGPAREPSPRAGEEPKNPDAGVVSLVESPPSAPPVEVQPTPTIQTPEPVPNATPGFAAYSGTWIGSEDRAQLSFAIRVSESGIISGTLTRTGTGGSPETYTVSGTMTRDAGKAKVSIRAGAFGYVGTIGPKDGSGSLTVRNKARGRWRLQKAGG